jgi:hypothetical protein
VGLVVQRAVLPLEAAALGSLALAATPRMRQQERLVQMVALSVQRLATPQQRKPIWAAAAAEARAARAALVAQALHPLWAAAVVGQEVEKQPPQPIQRAALEASRAPLH